MKKILLLMIFFACLINYFPSVSAQNEVELLEIKIKYDVRIKDIDPQKLIARIDVRVIITNFPVEADQIICQLSGIDNPQIILHRNNPRQYQGELFDLDWYIAGMGDMYPFDYYILDVFTATGNIWYLKARARAVCW